MHRAELQAYPATQHAQQTPAQAHTAKKLAQHGKNRSFWPILGTLGEKFRVCNARTPCRASFLPQTTTHQPRSAHAPVQNSPGIPHLKAKPVQNSPHTAKNTYSSPFEASREKIIPVQTQTTRAGRIFSRRPPLTSHAAHTHGTKFSPQPRPQGRNRYKTLRAIPASRPTGTKLSPHSPTRTRTLKVACNSITARIRAYSKTLESQGSVITARRTHWGIACETAEHPERRHTKRGR